jgi:hypothetical protein
MRLPKISHADMARSSRPEWLLPMFTSRMKRESPPPAIANIPINLLPVILFAGDLPPLLPVR